MNHNDLIKRGFLWLKNTKGCSVVVSELVSASEVPDVVGWHGWASILIEAKVSLSDFRADQEKSFRRHQERGMGAYRYYIVPEDIADAVESKLPEKWGLLVCKKRGIRVVRKSEGFETNLHNELGMLISLVRRISASNEPADGVGVKRYIELLSSKNPKAVYYASVGEIKKPETS